MVNKIQSIQRNLFKVTDSVKLDSGVTVPCITGQTSQVEIISQNGYRYRKGFWDKVLSDPLVQDAIKNRDFLCTIEHPKNDNDYLKTPYDQASHVIIKAWVDNGNPFAVLGILNNERGNNIKALVDVGHKPGVSTRGLGEFAQDEISQYVSENNYVFLGWDIVVSPNFSDLHMERLSDSIRTSPLFKELVDMHQLKDSADEHYSKSSLTSSMSQVIDELRSSLAKFQSLLNQVSQK